MAKTPVLIVDDSPANLKVARVALEASSFEVRTATGGEEAWRLLQSFAPAVVLMDLQMPGLDGFELTRRIKADPTRQHIRVIAVTAYAMKGDRERALAAGCDGYIAKPIDPILLPELVASHVSAQSDFESRTRVGERPTILVIEDNPTTRKLIRVALESDGYDVIEAPEARAALSWVEQRRARLILQDLMLPDMDGLELVKRLRALPNAHDVPILCLSGFLTRMNDAHAIHDGFTALLIKPIDPIQLLEIVRVHLEAPRAAHPRLEQASWPLVLVADDDPLQRRLAEYHLSGAGYRVQTVPDAKRALLEAERRLPDAIVSDVLMPEMDGFELCLTIRRHPLLARIPVVLVSSHYLEAADRKLAEQVGANALVPRSGDWSGALELVRNALGQREPSYQVLDAEQAREAILRRTLAQLERQLQANTQLAQHSAFQAAQLSVLAGVADALAHKAKLDDVLGDVLAVCLDLAGISKGALYLRGELGFTPKHWIGFGPAESAGLGDFFGHRALLEQLIAGGQVAALGAGDGDEQAEDLLRRAGIDAALVVPVAWGERTYGALLLGTRHSDVIGQEPAAFARVLGGQMGQAIGLAETFERLHASEQHVRALVESMDHVTVVDREQRITGLYGRGLEREQIHVASVIGKRWTNFFPHDRAAHDAAHARAMAGESVVYEWALGPGPGERHFQAAVFPVRDSHGTVDAVVRVGRDITEQKLLQAQIMVADRMASVGMLAAGVAHEINNPLMAVLGNLQLALDEPSSASDMREALEEAREAALRVESIVKDLRLFSRVEEATESSVDVQAVLESTLRMARNEIRHRAELVREYGKVPAVRGNGPRLGQVFLNLLINAAQALPDGHADKNEIRVSTRLDAEGRVVVEIADTGPGIPVELRPKLFSPFVTTKPAGVGTGLGLSICQRIVTQLGGEISFQSELGRGTVFRVALPAEQTAASERHRPVPRKVAAQRRGGVLVIDDDAAVRTLVRRCLVQDHEVVCSPDARQALELIRAGASFDVILCDLMMPHMTGVEFYQELAVQRPELAQRTVFLTGGAFTPATHEFVERVGPICLEKPFDLLALRAFVNERVA